MWHMFQKSSESVAAIGRTLLVTFLYARVRAVVLGDGSSGNRQGADEGLCCVVLLAEWGLTEEGGGLSTELLALVITEITLMPVMWPLQGRAGT
jgi:hypothetical protein